jgi:hypothetical protein
MHVCAYTRVEYFYTLFFFKCVCKYLNVLGREHEPNLPELGYLFDFDPRVSNTIRLRLSLPSYFTCAKILARTQNAYGQM